MRVLLKPLLWLSISECNPDNNERMIKSKIYGEESHSKPSYMNQYVSMLVVLVVPI